MTTLLPHHAAELIDGSGIDPTVSAARGVCSITAGEALALGFADYQAGAGLLFPQWTLAGAQVGALLKRDEPRPDEKGKPIKYEAPAGSVPHFDVHPDALAAVRDVTQTLYFGEGTKKGDAGWSRGLPCISITGVWQFLNGRLVVPDLDEIPLKGRLVRAVFDSDVTRKTSVAEALLRFCAALHRRGATVEVIYLPEGPNGAKVGLDDFFAAGHTVADLDALAVRWDGTGPGIWLRDTEESDTAQLRRRLAEAAADNRALVSAINVLSLAELRAAVATGALVASKLSRGDVDANGDVIIFAAEVANDYRPKPEPGDRLAPTNPDGTRPRMARSNVKPLLTQAVAAGALRAKPIPVDRKHAGGAAWRDTAWVVSPVASLAEALNPWVATRTQDPKERKPRTVTPPCPHCGEVHPIKRVDYCTGCGAQVGKPKIIEPETGDTLSPVRRASPSPAPRRVGRSPISGLPKEPTWPADAPPPEWGDNSSPAPRAFDVERRLIATASHTGAPDAREALDTLGAQLAAAATARGRTPVPKPSRASDQPDPWLFADAPGGPGCDHLAEGP